MANAARWSILSHMGTWRRRARRPLAIALAQLAAAAVALAFTELALLAAVPDVPAAVLLLPGLGFAYVAAGVVAWARRPGSGTGPLLTAGGLVWLLVSLGNLDSPALIAVGQVLATVPLAIVVHLLLAFPSGRLVTVPSRAIAITGYAVCLLLQAPSYLFTAQPAPYDVLFVADRPDLAAVGADVQSAVGAAVMVATTVVLARRLRGSTAGQRRVLAPLYTYGVLAVLWVPLSINVFVAVGVEPLTAILTQVVVLAGLPVAFLLGVLRGGFARTGELEELATALGSGTRGHPGITQAVAGVLGDPSLEVSYIMPDASQVDADGRPVQAACPGPGRAVVEVDRDGWPVARIAYDTTLVPEHDHVVAVGRVVAIELDRERLTAELRGRTRDLEHSRARLVRAADDERRRIAQDLHDGLQVQLVLLGLEAGRLGDRGRDVPDVLHRAEDLRRGLDAAAAELRRLVHGLMPAVLVERGLVAALEDLVGLMPLPTTLHVTGADGELSPMVETTAYFVVAEALTNAAKHSRADKITVVLHRSQDRLRLEVADDGRGTASVGGGGAGLRGIADRLDVAGGTLRVDSDPAHGTTVVGEVPCGR